MGDGQSVRFWWDLWVTNNVPLIAYATNTIPVDILECKMADFVDANGAWCWSRFDRYLPNYIILDTIFWAHSKHDDFTTSSAYLAL